MVKLRNKIVAIIAAVCLLLSTGVVNAAQHEIEYIKSLNGEYLIISGTVTDGADQDVFIRIEKTDETLSADTDSLETSVAYQKQITTDANGAFSVDVKLGENESYTMRLGVLGDDSDISETFVFYGTGYQSTVLHAIQTAQRNNDADALANAISTYYPNLYLEAPLFDAYYGSDSDLSETKSILVRYPLISSISMLEEALEGVVIVKGLKGTTGYGSLETVLSTYDAKLGIINSTIYQKTYSGMSPQIKRSVYNSFKGSLYYTSAEIKDAFTLAVLNTYLVNAIGATPVKTVLSDNAEMLGINMADYEMSDAKFRKLLNTEFTSVSAVKTKLDELKTQPDEEPDSDNDRVPSGGGGGGSSGAPITPVVGQDTVPGTYPFVDMENYGWAKEATLALYESGVLNGVGNGCFAPQRVITREEFLKLIINGFNIQASTDHDVSFGDVDKAAWYYPFIKTGVQSGVVNGMDQNKFGIGNQITRQDMVVMLYRAINMKKEISEGSGFCSFEDYDAISDYAKDAVSFAEANEIVNGMGDGNFHPESHATRAEAAVILYRAIGYLSNNL